MFRSVQPAILPSRHDKILQSVLGKIGGEIGIHGDYFLFAISIDIAAYRAVNHHPGISGVLLLKLTPEFRAN
jgi:hypothetical protein